MCGLNNWKDELPFTETQGGEGSPLAFGDDQGSVLHMSSLSCLSCIQAELLSQQLHLRVWSAGRGAV